MYHKSRSGCRLSQGIIQDMNPPPAFTLRPIETADLPAVLAIYQQCEDFLALGPQPRASWEMVIADYAHAQAEGSHFCGIYLPGGELAGIVDYLPSGFEGQPACAFLELLMIAAPYRRQGLGEAVFRAVEAEIRKDPGVTEFRAGVQVNNPAAIRFWQRMGFVIASPARAMPDGTTAYQLWKPLSAEQ